MDWKIESLVFEPRTHFYHNWVSLSANAAPICLFISHFMFPTSHKTHRDNWATLSSLTNSENFRLSWLTTMFPIYCNHPGSDDLVPLGIVVWHIGLSHVLVAGTHSLVLLLKKRTNQASLPPQGQHYSNNTMTCEPRHPYNIQSL